MSVSSSPSCRVITRHAKRMNHEFESMHPLGSPVVPDVYCTLTRVCESISTTGGASFACASMSAGRSRALPPASPSTHRISYAASMSARTSSSSGTSSRIVMTARIPACWSTKPASAVR